MSTSNITEPVKATTVASADQGRISDTTDGPSEPVKDGASATIKGRGRGRPRKYLLEESKTKYRENALKYNKEHAAELREQAKENYVRKTYINNQKQPKYHTAYSEMYGTVGIST